MTSSPDTISTSWWTILKCASVNMSTLQMKIVCLFKVTKPRMKNETTTWKSPRSVQFVQLIPPKSLPQNFLFGKPKKKTVKLVQNGSSGGESESEKEDALLARYKCPWGKERLLGWNLKSRICFCWDVFFSSLESKVVGLFFLGGDWGT